MEKNLTVFRGKIRENPFLGALIVTLLTFLLNRSFAHLFGLIPAGAASSVIEEVTCIVWPLALVYVCGFMDIFHQPGMGKAIGVGMLQFVLYLVFLLGQILQAVMMPEAPLKPAMDILIGILIVVGIGLREEMIFRGIIVNLFAQKYFKDKTKSPLVVAAAASFFFGVVHMSNVLFGVNVIAALVQSVVAMGVGMVLCAIYMRSGSIWGVALIHMTVDAAGLFSGLFYQGGDSAAVVDSFGLENLFPLLIVLPLALFLLRKSKHHEIYRVYERMFPEA